MGPSGDSLPVSGDIYSTLAAWYRGGEKLAKKQSYFHDLSTQKAIAEAKGVKWILGDPEIPVERIANLPDLLRRLPQEMRVDLPKSGEPPKDQNSKDAWMLHAFRNKFTHFPSVGWSLEIVGLPRIIRVAVELVDRIVTSGSYKRYNCFSGLNIKKIVVSIQDMLDKMENGQDKRWQSTHQSSPPMHRSVTHPPYTSTNPARDAHLVPVVAL